MPQVIDTYRKDTLHKAGHGFGRNIGSVFSPKWVAERGNPLSTVVIHTTNNPNKGTKFWNEATFIRDSPDVSCHDLIGKDGTIALILPPDAVAWHAGASLIPFGNTRSYGVEIHCSVGETPTQAQIDSLSWRMRALIATYGLTPATIETHRAVALPPGRKSDPEGFPDAQFYAWRDSLFVSTEPDWAVLWGTAWPYFSESGIAQTWRDQYRLGKPLGKAISDELQAVGVVLRCFERGYITWNAAAGTKVGFWS